jgi:hypothetical protein
MTFTTIRFIPPAPRIARRLAAGAATAATALAAAGVPGAQEPAPVTLEPFTASYAIVWKGMNAGTNELQLERRPNGQYLYTSRSNARGLFRLVLRGEILQTTTVEVDARGVRPLQYRGDDGTSATDRDISLDFDWSTGAITGVAENKKVHLDLPAGVQDPMSIQLALIHDLRAGREVSGYRMADKDEIKTYVYTYEGKARIETDIGALDTVVYSSHREGASKRVTRMWHAPSLGHIPVKAERIREGKREWLMEIRNLKQG